MSDWMFGKAGGPQPPSFSSDQWPTPLSEAAYYGPMGDIVKALTPQTEADPAALLVHMLVMFGNVVGRSAHFRVGGDLHHTNLFAGVVGTTSKGRKGVSRGHAQRLFKDIDPEWVQNITAGLSSGEGLIWAVRDKIEKMRPVRDGQRIVDHVTVVEDEGIADKRLLVIESELASTLKVMARDGNTLSPILRQAWDGYDLRSLTKSNPARATKPHISVVGHITRDELRRYLDATECANGFGNRFLWVCVRRQRELPNGGDPVDLGPYMGQLQAAITYAVSCDVLDRTVDADALWEREYGRLSTGRPGLLGAMTGRAEAQVMRLAVLYALSGESGAIDVAHLLAGLEVWRYCYDSARYLFGDKLGDPLADTLLNAIRTAYPESLTRTELHNLMGRNRPAADIDRALHLLAECKLATAELDRSGGAGRPSERWVACKEGDANPGSFVKFVSSSTNKDRVSPSDSHPKKNEINEISTIKAELGKSVDAECNTSAPKTGLPNYELNELDELTGKDGGESPAPDVVFAGVTYKEMDVVNWVIGAMVVNKGQPMQESELAQQVGIDAELIHKILCRYPHLFLNLASEDQEDCWVRRVLIDGGAQ